MTFQDIAVIEHALIALAEAILREPQDAVRESHKISREEAFQALRRISKEAVSKGGK